MKIIDKHWADLKDRILENETDASHGFFEIVVKVFERIPETDGETILGKNFYLVIPFSNTVYKRKINSGACWLVFLLSDLWDQKGRMKKFFTRLLMNWPIFSLNMKEGVELVYKKRKPTEK